MPHSGRISTLVAIVLALTAIPPATADAQAPARTAYQRLLARERALAEGGRAASPASIRRLVAQYQDFAGRCARTGYADNALWQAARLAGMLGARTNLDADRASARRLLQQLISGYPSSSLVEEARAALSDL